VSKGDAYRAGDHEHASHDHLSADHHDLGHSGRESGAARHARYVASLIGNAIRPIDARTSATYAGA
jgi:hypothetical protein